MITYVFFIGDTLPFRDPPIPQEELTCPRWQHFLSSPRTVSPYWALSAVPPPWLPAPVPIPQPITSRSNQPLPSRQHWSQGLRRALPTLLSNPAQPKLVRTQMNECIMVGVFKENFNHLTINANFYKQSLFVLHVIDVCRYQLKMNRGDYLLKHIINNHKLILYTNFCREEVSPGSS